MSEEKKKIIVIHSVAPYEDAKSVISTAMKIILFIAVFLIILICTALYYLGLAVEWLISGLVWLWRFPYFETGKVLHAMENKYGAEGYYFMIGIFLIIALSMGLFMGLAIGKIEDRFNLNLSGFASFCTIILFTLLSSLPLLWICYFISMLVP